MSHLLALFLIILQHCSGLKIEKQQEDGELVFTNILYRHGERSPVFPYANDPYKNESFWPMGFGQLTNNGKRQHYELGKWLRQRYISLIPDGRYSVKVVYVRSTDWDRTLMSAQSNLAGMFNPTPAELWSDIKWQPVPVHSAPKEFDKLLAMEYPCPKYIELYTKFYNSGFMKSYKQKHLALFDSLTKHAGQPVDDPIKVQYLYSTLKIQEMNNYTLPEWAQKALTQEMYEVAAFGFKMKVFTKSLKRLYSGPLLKEMVEHMKAKKFGTLSPDRNIFIYSVHDVTINGLLETMGVLEAHLPDFAATVLVDLRKKNDEFYVSIRYKNSTAEPIQLTIPGCAALCPLDQFENLLSDVIPADWDAECKTSLGDSVTLDQQMLDLAENGAINIENYIINKLFSQ